MSGRPRRGILALVAALALHGCAAGVDGPSPAVTSVQNEDGTSVICTCDDLLGCVKDENDVLTINGSGFAPLPVKLLEAPALELPTVKLSGPAEFVIDGKDPASNPDGVRLDYKDPTALVLTLSPAFVKGMPVGKYTVTVINPNGNVGELVDAFEVVAGPVLESVSPAVVCDEVDTEITLTGKNFRQGAKVLLGDEELAGATVVDATTITATVPKGFVDGKYDVTVVNPEGCSSALPEGLEVVPPPTIEKVEPAVVCTGGNLTITGTGFRPGATVTIGTTDITGDPQVTVDPTGTTLTVNVGPMTPGGPYDVKVTNPDGCSSDTLP